MINKGDSSSDITIFIISLISSLEIINVVLYEAKSEGQPDPKIFLSMNPTGIKMLLANGLNTFPIKGNQIFGNGPKSLPKNSPVWSILCYWIFDNFILAEELFPKAWWGFETCVLVNNNLCGKFFSSLESPTTFSKNFKSISVPFFVPDWIY